jgi:hypothetical protein
MLKIIWTKSKKDQEIDRLNYTIQKQLEIIIKLKKKVEIQKYEITRQMCEINKTRRIQ